MTARPVSVSVAAVLLVLLAVLSALTGAFLSWVSNCCGSPDPADGTPLLVGLLVAACTAGASVALWTGQAPRWVLSAAAVPVAVTVWLALFAGVDFLQPAALLLAGLAALAVACRSARWRGWLTGR